MVAVANSDKMICPRCGVEMNHHGDKIVYNADIQDAGKTELSLGGVIEEFHTCPKCGGGASRLGR
jgi:ribosomal protein S27AE